MVTRTCMVTFGGEPSAGAEEAIYSTPLMLRWIARCTSDWIRFGISVRSMPAGALMLVLLLRTIDGRRLSIAAHRPPPVLRSIRSECPATLVAIWPWPEG